MIIYDGDTVLISYINKQPIHINAVQKRIDPVIMIIQVNSDTQLMGWHNHLR